VGAIGCATTLNKTLPYGVGSRMPGDNRPQRRWRTQLILPVSGCDTNAWVRADA